MPECWDGVSEGPGGGGGLRDGQGGWDILMTYRGQGVLLPCVVTALPRCLSSWSVQALGEKGGVRRMVSGKRSGCTALCSLACVLCLISELLGSLQFCESSVSLRHVPSICQGCA